MASLKEVMSALPPDVLAKAAPHLEKLERYSRQTQRDAEIVGAVIRTLKNPNQQRLADELRNLVMKGTKQ